MNDFLDEIFICYFCGQKMHNSEKIVLFDGRVVDACDGCNRTVLKIQKRYGKN